MALKIFGTDPEDQPQPRQAFADDVVGRFRSGHQLNGLPAALEDWRVTTDDPEVAANIQTLMGGDEPQEWEAKGGDNIEVFTTTKSVEIILAGSKAVRERMVLWGRNGKLIMAGDGETLDWPEDKAGTPDPDADLPFAERKAKGQDGTGMTPQIEVYFKLADQPDLGVFKFQTGSWSLARDLAADRTVDQLEQIGGPVRATLDLEHVEFTAKNGKRAGQLVSFTKPNLKINGGVDE